MQSARAEAAKTEQAKQDKVLKVGGGRGEFDVTVVMMMMMMMMAMTSLIMM